MRSLLLALGAFFIATALTGCTHLQRLEIPAESELGAKNVQDFISERNREAAKIKDLKSVVLAEVLSGSRKDRFRYAVVFAPKGVRLEVFPTTSFYSLALLVVRSDKFTLLDYQSNEALEGVSPKEAFNTLLGFPFDLGQLSALVTGKFPESGELKGYKCATESTCVAALQDGIWGRYGSTGRLEELKFFDESRRVKALASRHVDESGTPTNITLDLLQHDVKVTMTFGSVRINTDPKDSLFVADIPESFERVNAK